MFRRKEQKYFRNNSFFPGTGRKPSALIEQQATNAMQLLSPSINMKTPPLNFALILSLSAFAVNQSLAQQYEVVELTSGSGHEVNEAGWVAGQQSPSNAYLWQQSGNNIIDLDAFASAYDVTLARSVNRFGNTVFNAFNLDNSAPQALYYDFATNTSQFLSTGSNAGGYANHISNGGVIAGKVNPVNTSNSLAAYWMSSASNPTIISGADGFTDANAAMDFVGWQAGSTVFTNDACLYRQSNATLYTLPAFGGGGSASANSINSEGLVVGDSDNQAAIWIESGPGLGTFQINAMQSADAVGQVGRSASDINNMGMAVGYLQSTRPAHNGNYQAFLYYDGFEAFDRAKHLEDFVVSGPEVRFEFANSVDERGWIVGTGAVRYPGGSWQTDRTLLAKPLLSLMPPLPGTAGNVNEFLTFGAAPSTKIYMAYSLNPNGSTDLSNWCPGLILDMANAQLATTGVSNSNGKLNFNAMVPMAAAGRTVYLQAFDLRNCKKSNLLSHTF
jgi:hypothetical protein